MIDSTAKEQYYDEHVAPKLFAIGEECQERGMAFVAACEFGNGDYGGTVVIPEDTSYALRLIYLASQARGNIDNFMISVAKHAREHGHSSIFLKQLGIPTEPTKTGD